MAIPSQEIGYGTEEKLLWQISKQIQNLIGVTYNSGSGFSTTYVPYTGATSNVNLGSYNISANSFINGFSSITASGTQVVLTVNSAPEILVSGSGGQTIKLPDATTLANGTIFSFNNNQSSGAISVNNNSNTLVLSIPSGGYAEIMLLSNSIAAGSWDRHFQAPSNVSWSTNTLDYPGSITSATWNGNVIQPNRGGTGQSTYTDGQLLIGNTTGNTLSKSTLTPGTGISIVNGNGTITITATGAVSGAVTGSGTTNYVPKFTSSTVVGNSNIQDSGSLITLGSNTTISSGSLGIGTSSLSNYSLRVGKNITGSTISVGIANNGQVQSDVTDTANGFYNVMNTQATAFTLSNYNHYYATQSTIGSGSAITNQFGFYIDPSLIGATNNYGFYGNIPSGTNRWNIYMGGTASNYLAGKTSIGDTFSVTGGTVIPSGFNGIHLSFASNVGYIQALQVGIGRPLQILGFPLSFGSSNTGTIFASFLGSNGNFILQNGGTFTDAGYRLDVNGTTRLQGDTYISSGGLGIGTTFLTGFTLNIAKNITGATVSYGIAQTGTIQSDVTSSVYSNISQLNTQATTFTLADYRHYFAGQGTIGSGSTITSQYGFLADSSMIGATNNFGFFGNIPSGTNRWNIYMNGTANNYLAGSLGIGILSSGDLSWVNLLINKRLTGLSTTFAILQKGSVQSDVSTSYGFYNELNTQATTFALGNYTHFIATQSTLGSGSTLTNQYGFVANSSLTGGTNNYGFKGEIPSGTNRWNLYMNGTANNYLAGSLLIGSTTDTGEKLQITGTTKLDGSTVISSGFFGIGSLVSGISLNVSKNITGGVISYGIAQSGVSQSDVTTSAYGFTNTSATVASAYTLSQYFHYSANQGTIGAGSAITTQIGFDVATTLIGATNNFGFRGRIPSGTNRWNIYMDGTADNFLAGSLGIGTTSLGNASIRVGKLGTGATTTFGIDNQTIFQSDVTNGGTGYNTYLGTQAASFTLVNFKHYNASVNTIGAGSSVTRQYGFVVDASCVGATNNFGFVSSIPSATNNWNLYLDGTANNFMAGSLGIGLTGLTQYSLRVAKNITGNVFSFGISQSGIVQSDVTSAGWGFQNQLYTAAASFTLTNYYHFFADQQTIGAGSTVNNQYGFFVGSSLIGATNNYGFRGQIPSGSNRWNIYMDGTADNYLAGNLGIGTTSLTGTSLHIAKLITGDVFSYGVYQRGSVQSDVTSVAWGFQNQLNTQATSFTLPQYRHYSTAQGTFGAGSTVTNQYGYFADNSMISATNNYGFYGSIPAGSNRWNIYMNGTAQNYLAGALSIGVVTANASALLQVDSTTQGVLFPRMTTTQKNAISSPATGLVVFDTTLGKLCVFSTTWQTLTSS